LPTIEALNTECNLNPSSLADEPPRFWADKILQRAKTFQAKNTSQRIMELIQQDKPDAAIELAGELYHSFDAGGQTEKVNVFGKAADKFVDRYKKRRESFELSGVTFGFPFLDEVSDGAQVGDTIAIVGRPGLGKSYVLFHMARCACMTGESPLVVTLEMPETQCVRRIMALHTGISATEFKRGAVDFWGDLKVQNSIADFSKNGNNFYFMEGTLMTTVESIGRRIQELKPSVVYIDGAYLLRSKAQKNSRWEMVAHTAEYLKRLAADCNIPIFATYQFNRKGAGDLGNIGSSDVVGQLASIVISIDHVRQDSLDRKNPAIVEGVKQLELIKGRDGEKGKIRILYDMKRMRIEQDAVLEEAMS
jgi:replicative DNA helicase